MTTITKPDTQSLERAVRSYVAAGSGLASTHVVPGNRGGPAQDELFATVLLIRSRFDGAPASRVTRNGTTQIVTGAAAQDRYSVQWYRKGAMDAARRFRLWTASSEAQEQMEAAGLAFVRAGSIRQLDDIVSDAWEERAGLDLDIGYIQTLRQDAQEIAAVPIQIAPDGAEIEIVELNYDLEP